MTGDDSVSMHSVSPEYLKVVGGRLLGGRFLQSTDSAAAGHVAVLNDVAARRIFAGGDPLGQTLDFFGPLTVVGVVQAQHLGGPEIPVRPEMYVPISQGNTMFGSFGQLRLIVRAGTSTEPLATAVGRAVQSGLPAGQRVSEPESLDDTFRRLTADRRFSAGLMTLFGVTAMAIGALGVYGVMAFLVGQRTREVGVRVALGATRQRILLMMLGQAAVPIAIGLLLGLVAAWAATGLVAAALLGVQPTDPVVVISVVVVLVVVGLGAALVPALRASRVDPIIALRAE
jgi:ABC-type antimicrobial peptide transport system permease subunit